MTIIAMNPAAGEVPNQRQPPALADDRAEPALSAEAPSPQAAADPSGLPPVPPPAAPDRPEELAPSMPPADMADETVNSSRILQRFLEKIPQAESAIAKRVDERLAELPAAIESRLTAPPRRNAPPEAVPNLLERAQGAGNETNLANFLETPPSLNQARNQPCD